MRCVDRVVSSTVPACWKAGGQLDELRGLLQSLLWGLEKKLKNKSFSNLQSNRCSRKIFFNRTGDLYDIRPSIQDGETPNKSITVFIFGMRIVDIIL